MTIQDPSDEIMSVFSTQPFVPKRRGCLADHQLQSLLNETLSEHRQMRISAHIEQCEPCQQRLEQLVSQEDGDLPTRETEFSPQLAQAGDLVTCLQRVIAESLQQQDAGPPQQKTLPLDGETHNLDHLRNDAEVMPRDFGRWRFRGLAGEGGMAVVFRAHDDVLDEAVAVKMLRQRYATHETVRAQFLQEVVIQSQLHHPGIANIHASGELPGGRLYMVMEYRHGRTLSHMMRYACPHEMSRMLDVFGQVCEVMAEAHQQGVRHRDLKPANILIDAAGEVSVLDWGLAETWRDSPDDHPSLPRVVSRFCHTVAGTPGYLAPEQLRGRSVGPAGDVYALGVILAEILLGERLRADEQHDISVVTALKTSARLVNSLESRGIRDSLVELVRRCLAASPLDRLHNAGELLSQLGACQVLRTPARQSEAGPRPSGSVSPRMDRRRFLVHPSEENIRQSLLGRCKNTVGEAFNDWKGAMIQAPLLH